MNLGSLLPGDLIAFRIAPRAGFSNPNAGRWGVVKLLRQEPGGLAVVSVLDGLADSCPSARSVRFRKVLRARRFHGRQDAGTWNGPVIFTALDAAKAELPEARVIGRERLPRLSELLTLVAVALGGGTQGATQLAAASEHLDHEDRALRDSAAWEDELARAAARTAEAQSRRRTTTLAELQSAEPFAPWATPSAFIPPAAAEAMRADARHLLASLAGLGDKPARAAVRKNLRAFVDRLNALSGTPGVAIETEERAEIMDFLEEVCITTGQAALIKEVDTWREW